MNVYPEEIADPEEPAKLSSKGAGTKLQAWRILPIRNRRGKPVLAAALLSSCGASDGVRDLELIAPVSARAHRRVSIAGG